MTIKIDKRSDDSAYIEVGNITVYVEHSNAAPECVHIWKNAKEDLFKNGVPGFVVEENKDES